MLRRNDNGMLAAGLVFTRKTLSPSHQAIADLSQPLTFTRNAAGSAVRRIYSYELAREGRLTAGHWPETKRNNIT